MKYLLIAAIIAVLVIAGITAAISWTVTANEQTGTSEPAGGCSSCANGCTADKNCGLATCGATVGKTCGCNKG